MNIPFTLENETALITGGGSGIGLGIATCMVQAGARVVLVGRRALELTQACTRLGSSATHLVQDITRLDELDHLTKRAEQASGSPISILVNNAGIHLKEFAVDTTPEAFQSVLQTHVLAAHTLTRAVLPGMIERRHGNVLFTASMVSYIGMPKVVAYAAAKSAYLGMIRVLAVEVSQYGVRVNGIAPGWITTDMTRKALDSDPERKRKILSRTPMGILGDPMDIGWAAVYFCSAAAKFVTGMVLPVDGGASIGF